METTNVITIEKNVEMPTTRGYTSHKKYNFVEKMEVGDSFVDCVNGLRAADDVAEVEEYMTAIGRLLEGQFITGTIRHSNTGWANLHAEKFDISIGAASKVTV